MAGGNRGWLCVAAAMAKKLGVSLAAASAAASASVTDWLSAGGEISWRLAIAAK